ncbi:unnamed protein product, partial [Urochloa humidicola]
TGFLPRVQRYPVTDPVRSRSLPSSPKSGGGASTSAKLLAGAALASGCSVAGSPPSPSPSPPGPRRPSPPPPASPPTRGARRRPPPRRPRPLPLVRGVVVSAASPSPLDAIRAAKNQTAAFPWVPRRETRRALHISRRARPRPRRTITKMGAAGAARRGHAAVEPPSTPAVGGGQEGGVRRPGNGGGSEPQQEETTLPLSGRR